MVIFQTRKRAFTLIELLIVITIIGILAVALVPRLTGGPARARDAQRKSDLQQIAVALELYASDYGGYPASTGCIGTLGISSYLTTIPADPQSLTTANAVSGSCSGGYGYIALQPTSGGYAEGYLLVAELESTTETANAGIYYNSSAGSATTTGTNATATYNLASTGPGTLCTSSTTACTSSVNRFYMIGR